MDNSPPGNFAGRQRKMQQEQSLGLFPSLNGVALGTVEASRKKKTEKEGEEKHTSKTTLASISSRSNSQSYSGYSRSSSYFSAGRSDRSSSHLSSSSLSLRSLSPCEPTCNPIQLYKRTFSGNTGRLRSRCSTSLPESIIEEDTDEGGNAEEAEAKESNKKKKKRKKRRRRHTIVTSTGRHFMDCKIPKHIIESLDPLPIIAKSSQKEVSPMHGTAKQEWINKLTEAELSSLPFTSQTVTKPVIKDCPCPQASFLREAFRKYCKKSMKYPPSTNTAPAVVKGDPSQYLFSKALLPSATGCAPKPSISAGNLKSLLLNHNDHFNQRKPDHTPATMFTHCPAEGLWFVVHPDFRSEPGMRGVDPGKRGPEPW